MAKKLRLLETSLIKVNTRYLICCNFANLYSHFIWDFNIAATLLVIVKITKTSEVLAIKAFAANNNSIVGSGDSLIN